MKVTTEADGPCRQIMHVDIPADAVQSAFDTVTEQFMREARLPGFRPGRAPRAMVERRYAKPIAEQVRDQLLPEYYRKAVEQERVEPVNIIDITPETPAPGQDMAFKVTVDLAPEFDTPDYHAIALADETAPTTDAGVDAALLDIRRRRARYPEVDRPAVEHDLVCFDYDGSSDGDSLEEIAGDCRELCSGRDVSLPLIRERELFPGFHDALLGVRKDEERRIEVAFPEDHPLKTVAGKTVVYQVRVKTVREEQLPEPDQNFFDEIKVKDEAELRKILREQLEHAAAENERRRRHEAVIRHLLDNTRIDELPQSLLAEENETAIQNLVQDFTRQGIPREKIEENRDDIMRWAERTSQERVKINIILDRIAATEKIVVSEDEFSRHISGLAANYRMSEADILKTIKERNASRQMMDQLRRTKTTLYLLENTRITPGGADAGDADKPSEEEKTSS